MARIPRGFVPAGVYHVNTRGTGPAPIFRDDDDRTMFISQLLRVVVRWDWILRAFCFMTTHYHLLVEAPVGTLQPGMRRLNGCYARAFNLRHGRNGHLFGERFHDVQIESDQHMLAILRYFARNPVEAGLCTTPSDWYWGSYRSCIGVDHDFPFVDASPFHAYFDTDADAMRRFVGDA